MPVASTFRYKTRRSPTDEDALKFWRDHLRKQREWYTHERLSDLALRPEAGPAAVAALELLNERGLTPVDTEALAAKVMAELDNALMAVIAQIRKRSARE